MMFKHILLPTDGSVRARKAIKAVIKLAQELGAKVTAYHALETFQPYLYNGFVADTTGPKSYAQHARSIGRKYLAEVAAAAEAAGVRCEVLMTEPEAPYLGIVAVAKKKKCDVILIASHGHGGFASLLLGSVTQKVLAHSNIPVLVYR
jgi:nucleotide-binding universal stress UspA family protein